jgi:hypothetical protein
MGLRLSNFYYRPTTGVEAGIQLPHHHLEDLCKCRECEDWRSLTFWEEIKIQILCKAIVLSSIISILDPFL